MATPLIAGSAALVRQYFLSGAYPTGKANAANVFKPSGALVKAVLIRYTQSHVFLRSSKKADECNSFSSAKIPQLVLL